MIMLSVLTALVVTLVLVTPDSPVMASIVLTSMNVRVLINALPMLLVATILVVTLVVVTSDSLVMASPVLILMRFTNVPEYSTCTNTDGSFVIACNVGYAKTDEGLCADINECDVDGVCTANSDCVNTAGSFRCDCHSGFVKADDGTCANVNECFEETDNCDLMHPVPIEKDHSIAPATMNGAVMVSPVWT